MHSELLSSTISNWIDFQKVLSGRGPWGKCFNETNNENTKLIHHQ
jgi:hypothetical protein